MKRLAVLCLGLVLTPQIYAESKRLVCEMSAEAEAKRWESFNNFNKAEICRNSEFGWRNTFEFDTNDLNSNGGKFEVSRENCNPSFSEAVHRGQMVATTSTITFTWQPMPNWTWNFNVDRKTLLAGKDLDRDFKCTIQDVDLSDNQI